ncbi:hypothetical protein COO60DRAFT_1183293 [Scenedesmus sp. NREL 46B-D3]|nr:hypothetical protein COO60DRAFT_1183293 [Scenedesmus sp. NREL 46B-D3]
MAICIGCCCIAVWHSLTSVASETDPSVPEGWQLSLAQNRRLRFSSCVVYTTGSFTVYCMRWDAQPNSPMRRIDGAACLCWFLTAPCFSNTRRPRGTSCIVKVMFCRSLPISRQSRYSVRSPLYLHLVVQDQQSS